MDWYSKNQTKNVAISIFIFVLAGFLFVQSINLVIDVYVRRQLYWVAMLTMILGVLNLIYFEENLEG